MHAYLSESPIKQKDGLEFRKTQDHLIYMGNQEIYFAPQTTGSGWISSAGGGTGVIQPAFAEGHQHFNVHIVFDETLTR